MSSDLSSSIEDYLEAILALSEDDAAVRVTDIAGRLNIAKSSVAAAISILKEKGFVRQRRYGKVYLTDEGIARAQEVKRKHRLLRTFLTDVLGVAEEIAEKDACLMEHVVSSETMERLIAFLEKTVSRD